MRAVPFWKGEAMWKSARCLAAVLLSGPLILPEAAAEPSSYDRSILRGPGVLVNAISTDEDFQALEGTVVIGGAGGKAYATLDFSRKDMAFRYIRNGARAAPSIRALHTDFNILIMDARPSGVGTYEAYVDGKWRPVRNAANLTYYPWPDFLKDHGSFIAQKNRRLVMYPAKGGAGGRMLPGGYSFNITAVDGDWVYAECDGDCEGCGPAKKPVKGWFRWRVANKLMVDLRYIC